MKSVLLSAAAVAAVITLGACKKTNDATAASDTAGAAAASDVTATSDATMAGSDASASASDAAAATNGAVSATQDAAAGPVGLASASTLGSVSAAAFVSNAGQSDMYEIQAAKIAQTKAKSPELKRFAAQMIKDHTASTAKLKAALPKAAGNLSAPTSLDQRRQGMIDNLNGAAPAAFDKEYAAQQVAAHQEALTLMQGYAKHGDNATLKGVAAAIAPTVQMHLDMIKKIQGSQKS